MKALAVLLLLVSLAAPARAVAAASPAPAQAAGTSDAATRKAKAHFRRGTDLYRQARYREAITEFEAAQRLRPHPVLLYNLAQCHERLGDIPAALSAYRDYLRASPGAEDRATVETAMKNLAARLGSSGVQQLVVYSQPPGAEVHVDAQPRGKTPLPLVLPLGRHTVAVSRPGFVTQAREVVLAAGASAELDLVLTPVEPPAPAAAAPAPAPGGDATGRLPPELAPSPSAAAGAVAAGPPAAPAPPGPRPRVWTWVAAGVAGAALAAGIAYGISAQSASNDIRNVKNDAAAAQQLADTASSRARTANILYGVAAAAGVAGTTLFFVEGSF